MAKDSDKLQDVLAEHLKKEDTKQLPDSKEEKKEKTYEEEMDEKLDANTNEEDFDEVWEIE